MCRHTVDFSGNKKNKSFHKILPGPVTEACWMWVATKTIAHLHMLPFQMFKCCPSKGCPCGSCVTSTQLNTHWGRWGVICQSKWSWSSWSWSWSWPWSRSWSSPSKLDTHGMAQRSHLSMQVTQESALVSSMNRHFCHSLHHHKCHRYRNHWSSSKIKHYPILIITSQTPDQILLVLPGGGDYTHFPQQRQIIVVIIIIIIQLCMLFVIIIIIQLCCHHHHPTSK